MTALDAKKRLVFPLDYPDMERALRAAELVTPWAGVLKVGLELFVREGPRVVEHLSARARAKGLDSDVFLDLKLHDIPATVDGAVASASSLGVRYITVHASGGPKMVEAAVRRAEKEGAAQILAVTVLTSLDDETLNSLGIARLHLSSTAGTARAHAGRLAWLAHNAGATGFVCAATEVFTLRSMLGPKVTLVTPGIRAAGAATDDQKRVASVQSAIEDGADLLVVGRPIRNAADPAAAARAIVKDIEKAAAS